MTIRCLAGYEWGRDDLINAISHPGRTHVFDRVAGLDDFDVETAAMLREHMRTPAPANPLPVTTPTSLRCAC